jgi:tetratricopeptide (TPR) repeat protein
MKKILISLLMLFIAVNVIFAESENFTRANKLYAKKQYSEAAWLYETIIKNEGVAPELYYNLGNAYFKSNELAKAILNYERALRIAPGYEDARFNLEFANQKVIDNIVMTDTFFLKKWIISLMKIQTSNGWFYTAVILFVLTLIAFLIFVFGSTKVLRKTFFYTGFVSLIISIASITFSGIRKKQMVNHREAIIMSGVIVIKGAPDKSGTDLFQLHEGSKIVVISTLGNWYEVKLGNGNVGWVEINQVEKI